MKKKFKHLWMVEEYVDKEGSARSAWTKVGVAFENRDGSWAIELAAVPVNGRLQMRDPKQERAVDENAKKAAA